MTWIKRFKSEQKLLLGDFSVHWSYRFKYVLLHRQLPCRVCGRSYVPVISDCWWPPSHCSAWGNLGEPRGHLHLSELQDGFYGLWLQAAEDVQSGWQLLAFVIPAAEVRRIPSPNVWSGVWGLIWKAAGSPCEG